MRVSSVNKQVLSNSETFKSPTFNGFVGISFDSQRGRRKVFDIAQSILASKPDAFQASTSLGTTYNMLPLNGLSLESAKSKIAVIKNDIVSIAVTFYEEGKEEQRLFAELSKSGVEVFYSEFIPTDQKLLDEDIHRLKTCSLGSY